MRGFVFAAAVAALICAGFCADEYMCLSTATYYTYSNGVATVYGKNGNGKIENAQSIGHRCLESSHQTPTKLVIEESINEIGNYAFQGLGKVDQLVDVEIKGHIKRVGQYAFTDAFLGTVTFYKDVDSFEHDAFNNAIGIDLVFKENAKVGYIDSAFSYSFYRRDMSSPASLVLRGDNITIDSSFWSSRKLGSVTVYGKVAHFGIASFSSCELLSTFTVDEFTGDLADSLFSGTKINYFGVKEGSVGKIANSAFSYVKSTSLYIDAPVESINESAFTESQFEEIKVKSIKSITSATFFSADKLTSLVIESGTSIGFEAFAGKTSLETVTIKGSVDSIGDYAFFGCSNLQSVTIEGSLGNIGAHAFEGCSNLQSVAFRSATMESIGDGAFYGCNSLSSFDVPASVSSIGLAAFGNCQQLKSIKADGNSNFKSVNGILFDYSGSSLVQYPCGIDQERYLIPDDVTSIRGGAFAGCSNLASLIVSDNNKNFQSIDGTLVGHQGTSLVAYPAGKSNNGYAIPSGLNSIESYAFSGCSSLELVFIPRSVTTINDDAFYDCGVLKSVAYQGSEPSATGLKQCSLTDVCVSPDYLEETFGGLNVTSDTTLCTRFRELFNRCYEADYSDGSFVSKERENTTEWISQSSECLEYVCDNEQGPKKNVLPCDMNPVCYIGGGTCNEETGKCVATVTEDFYSFKENKCYEVFCDTNGWAMKMRKNVSDWIDQTDECVLFGCDNASGVYERKKVTCNEKPAACYSATCNGETGNCTYEKLERWSQLIDKEGLCQHVVCDEEKGWNLVNWDNVTEWETQTNGCYLYYCDDTSGLDSPLVSERVCVSTADVSRVCMNGESCIENWKSEESGWALGIEFAGLDSNITDLAQNLTTLLSTWLENSAFGTEVDGDGKLLAFVIMFEDEVIAEAVKERLLNITNSEDCQYEALCEAENIDVYHKEPSSVSESKSQSDSTSSNSSLSESTLIISGSHSVHNVMAFVMAFVALVMIMLH